MAQILNNIELAQPIQPHSFRFISPIDGTAVSFDHMNQSSILFHELQKAGELIRELRAEVEALKSKVG